MVLKFLLKNNISFGGPREYQGINWYVFSIADIETDENAVINHFLKSGFSKKDGPLFKIDEPILGLYHYLSGAFNIKNLCAGDFRELGRGEILKYLDDCSLNWVGGPDEAFLRLINQLRLITQDSESSTDTYFLLDKDWFKMGNPFEKDDSQKGDPRLDESCFLFMYAYLIIWVDKRKSTLNVCEWGYD